MYYLNQTVFGLLNPMSFGILLLSAGLVFSWRRWRRTGLAFVALALVWFSFWSFGFFVPNLRIDIEELYPPQRVEELPKADAIVLLGGGISFNTNELVYAELHDAADRVWHAARLYKAGKAPVILMTGQGEEQSAKLLLRDLGVPDSALMIESEARNTEENAKFAARVLAARKTSSTMPRILLVTSALHMRRARFMFERAFAKLPGPRIDVIPAATDYEGLNGRRSFRYSDLFPSSSCMEDRTFAFKEILGYWGYRFLRK